MQSNSGEGYFGGLNKSGNSHGSLSKTGLIWGQELARTFPPFHVVVPDTTRNVKTVAKPLFNRTNKAKEDQRPHWHMKLQYRKERKLVVPTSDLSSHRQDNLDVGHVDWLRLVPWGIEIPTAMQIGDGPFYGSLDSWFSWFRVPTVANP
eukprot:gene27231-biopygen7579